MSFCTNGSTIRRFANGLSSAASGPVAARRYRCHFQGVSAVGAVLVT